MLKSDEQISPPRLVCEQNSSQFHSLRMSILFGNSLERFSYDLEIKKHEQKRNNKRTEIERFDWFIERIQTPVAFGWLSERSGEKSSCLRTL